MRLRAMPLTQPLRLTAPRLSMCNAPAMVLPFRNGDNYGITVNVTRHSSSTSNGGITDAAMRLVKAGVIRHNG